MKLKLLLLITITCAKPLYSQTADEYFNMASEAYDSGDVENQILFAEKAISIYESENHIDENYFICMIIASLGYHSQEKQEKAIELLEFAKRRYTDGHPEIYAKILENLAVMYKDIKNYSEAEELLKNALEIYKKIVGSEHPVYAKCLNSLSLLYKLMGNYTKAEPLFKEVLTIYKKVLGSENSVYAKGLNNLFELYESIGDYAKAEPMCLEALAVLKNVHGPTHPDVAAVISNLASLYVSLGAYTKAESLYQEALEIYKRIHGTMHLSYAICLNNLGLLYKNIGNYSKAETYYLQSLAIRKTVLGSKHPSYATSLHNLAVLYQSMGNYLKAESLYYEALLLVKNLTGQEHSNYANGLNNLAGLYEKLGDYENAEALYKEAAAIIGTIHGKEHPNYAGILCNLGGLYKNLGDYENAEVFFQEAHNIFKKVLGTKHLFYATSVQRLAGLYESLGDLLKAELMYLDAIKIDRMILGDEHPSLALDLNNLALLYSSKGNYDKAISLHQEALSIIQNNVKNTFASLSESEKTKFSGKDDRYYDILLSTTSHVPDLSGTTVYNRLLFRKGLVLNSAVNTRSFVLSTNDAALKQRYSDWISTKQVINNLYSKTIEQRAKSGFSLDSLEELANTLEKDLSRMSSTFQDFVMIPDYKWENVRGNLKPGEAVVDLVKYRLYDKRWTDTTRYGVFITKYDSDEEPVYLEFKDGNRIDTLLIPKLSEQNRNRFAHISPEVEGENVVVLNSNKEHDYYKELFAPIAHHLNGIKRIFFSLDGEFYKVNFNTLRNPATGKYLIEDYDIVYVSSANEIARGKKETTPNKSAILTGFPNYDLSLDSLTAIIKMEQGAEKSRDVYVNASKIQTYSLDLLPGTKEEVIVTSELLKKNGWKVDSWLFNEATESKVKGITAPGLLSISTHGFFSQSPKADYTENYFMGSETKKAIENPLLRSGLFLSGAETFLNSDETQKDNFTENGILTAYEASQLNLLGTDIVILSACETGLGEVNNGEGVFGLQRGFFGAGAKSVLMSLWKVDDTTTRDLMIEFIKNYSTTMNKQQSLRDAQLTIMKKYPQPYYWGAFVMVGL